MAPLTKDELIADIAKATGEQFADQGWEKAAEIMTERVAAVEQILTGTGDTWGADSKIVDGINVGGFGDLGLTPADIAEALDGLANLPKVETAIETLNAGIAAQSDHEMYAERVEAAAKLTEGEAAALNAFLASLSSAQVGGYVTKGGLARIHAGETIIPASGGAGSIYNINIGAGISDPTAVSEAVVEALRAYERGNGPVPVTTTASMYTASS